MGEWYIAVAEYHYQPPFETSATIDTRTRSFSANATMKDIWGWASGHIGDCTMLTRLEIRPDERD